VSWIANHDKLATSEEFEFFLGIENETAYADQVANSDHGGWFDKIKTGAASLG
jgi:hypothetical protein